MIDRLARDFTFDYKNQAWIRDGRYLDCSHPNSMDCQCYGRKYEGLTVAQVAEVKSADAERKGATS